MYDWAISGFQTTIIGAVLPIFFRQVACHNVPQNHLATSIWGYISSIAMTCVALLSLLLGPVSDHSAVKKPFLGLFTGIGIIFTGAMAFTGAGQWLWISILFIVASIAAAGSEVFYDGLLPHIAAPEELDRISTRGYAYGYLGGGLLLAVNILMIFYLPQTEIAPGKQVPLWGMQLSFISVAFWWGVFAMPLFKWVPEPPRAAAYRPGLQTLSIAVNRLKNTFMNIRKYKNAFILLLAFWLYSDGIGTVIKMATAYGDEIGIGYMDLIGAFVMVQFIGIPCTVLFGKIADVIGAKRSILLGLLIYTGISIGGFFMQKAVHFWILAGFVGMVQGGTQALSRSMYARMIPKDKSAEFFSFYTISGKFAGIMGPAFFALSGQLFHNSRYGILCLVLFFITGGILLLKVPDNPENGA